VPAGICSVDQQRHAPPLAGMQAHERLLEAQRSDRHGLLVAGLLVRQVNSASGRL
jgi:hypothetical protein